MKGLFNKRRADALSSPMEWEKAHEWHATRDISHWPGKGMKIMSLLRAIHGERKRIGMTSYRYGSRFDKYCFFLTLHCHDYNTAVVMREINIVTLESKLIFNARRRRETNLGQRQRS